MTRGKKPIAVFGYENKHIDYTARVATNKGVYVVESLKNGLYYFLEDGQVVIATSAGHMRINLETAELIAGELGGDGRMTITGVRWAESVRRKQNQGEVTIMNPDKQTKEQMLTMEGFSDTKKGGVVLNNDNAESRKMVEQCYKRSKTTVNPIIDWTDGEVWEFIHEYNVPYCELYDKGFKRLGCIGCPMSKKTQIEELELRPKYKRAYMRAFKRMLENSKARGLNPSWANEYEVYDWWIGKESNDDQGTR